MREPGIQGVGRRSIHTTGWAGCSGQRRLNVGVMGAGRLATTVQIRNILAHPRLKLKWITEDNPKQVPVVKQLFNLDDSVMFTSRDVPDLLSDKRCVLFVL